MLSSSYVKLKDEAGYVATLEKLLAYYPDKDYWTDAIRRVETLAGFADRLRLDALRLRYATGALTGAAQYAAIMQLVLNAGFPAEAKRIADLAAGQKTKAAAMFKDVQGTDGAADLAHLWLIQAQRS